MSKDRSEKAFLKFMDWLATSGTLRPATARSRRAAAKKILEVATEEEKQDLASIDADDLLNRFQNLYALDYKTESLQVYRSRFKSAFEDFLRYTENPSSFKPTLNARTNRPNAKNGSSRNAENNRIPPSATPPNRSGEVVFPIPLRQGLTVSLVNVPPDLTSKEAEKISAVVKALAEK